MGYFKDVGLEAEIIALSNGTAATAAVLSGSADVAFSNTMSLIVAHDKRLPARVIVGTDLTLNGAEARAELREGRDSFLRQAERALA